jgi:DNA-binding NarL/FixJ family response regulator
MGLQRPLRDQPFSARQCRLLEFAQQEVSRLVGGSLVSACEANLAGLTPRLRALALCLLEGDSEKQAAARLGLTPASCHQYVKAIYQHFHVSSRAELLAWFLRRNLRMDLLREMNRSNDSET